MIDILGGTLSGLLAGCWGEGVGGASVCYPGLEMMTGQHTGLV